MSSPTQRTLAKCRESGWYPWVVEKTLPGGYRRLDLYNFGDVLVMTDTETLIIQCTTTSNMAARIKKIRTECWEHAKRWLELGNKIEVWGWAKRKRQDKRGITRMLWTLKVHEVTL